jgi:hypothetical protein
LGCGRKRVPGVYAKVSSINSALTHFKLELICVSSLQRPWTGLLQMWD